MVDDCRASDDAATPANGRASPDVRHPSRLAIIVAMSRNRVIGANGRIPWHLPDELRLFKRLTLGHHIIMGRRTWESIGRPLPGRHAVIVSRQPGYCVPGAVVAPSFEAAVDACGPDDRIFVIGGSELFQLAMPVAGRLYLTTVDAEFAGDTLMPEFDPADWREIESQSHPIDARHPCAYHHAVYERARR